MRQRKEEKESTSRQGFGHSEGKAKTISPYTLAGLGPIPITLDTERESKRRERESRTTLFVKD